MNGKDFYTGADQKQYHFLFMISAKEASVSDDHRLTLKEIDHKVLFMTARPKRCRAFIPAERYLTTWAKNHSLFLQQPPEIAMIHSDMKEDAHGKAKAIPMEMTNPQKIGLNSWKFDSHLVKSGIYRSIVLFLDWLPALECPKPIQIEVPALFGGQLD